MKASSFISFNSTSLAAQKNKQKILQKVASIIDEGYFLQGKENQLLEKNFHRYFKTGYSFVCGSGHDALLLALQSLHLKPHDEVIFPVNAYPTAFPVLLSGAKAVLVDADENAQMNLDSLQKALTSKTKVVIVVHMYGLMGDIERVKKIIHSRGVVLIEDCAQSFGTKYKNHLAGTLGDLSCFSFYPTKNLGALGDGGAVWTKHKNLSSYLAAAVSYGEKERYNSQFISGHSRIPEIQAGILNLYFKELKNEFAKKKALYQYYIKKIEDEKLQNFIKPIFSHKNSSPVPHLFVVKTRQREKLRTFLKTKNIPTLIHYPFPINLVPAFSFLGYKKGDFPVAERLSQQILSLPFHSHLTKKKIDYIVKTILTFYHDKKNHSSLHSLESA